MKMSEKNFKKVNLQNKLDNFFEENYLDIQGLSPGMSVLDESYLARILTKLAIGSATVWWSLIEMKDFVSQYRTFRKVR